MIKLNPKANGRDEIFRALKKLKLIPQDAPTDIDHVSISTPSIVNTEKPDELTSIIIDAVEKPYINSGTFKYNRVPATSYPPVDETIQMINLTEFTADQWIYEQSERHHVLINDHFGFNIERNELYVLDTKIAEDQSKAPAGTVIHNVSFSFMRAYCLCGEMVLDMLFKAPPAEEIDLSKLPKEPLEMFVL